VCEKRSSLLLLVVEGDEYTHLYISTDEGSYSSGVGTGNDDGAEVGGEDVMRTRRYTKIVTALCAGSWKGW